MGPLNLATLGSESTLAWFRAAELKHSRVAMLATTGYIVQASGFHFPGMLSSDVSFEIISECQGPHYTKGGALPTIIFPPINFNDVDAELLARRQNAELNNGRLAMIAIISFCAAANIPGSVPLLTNNPMF